MEQSAIQQICKHASGKHPLWLCRHRSWTMVCFRGLQGIWPKKLWVCQEYGRGYLKRTTGPPTTLWQKCRGLPIPFVQSGATDHIISPQGYRQPRIILVLNHTHQQLWPETQRAPGARGASLVIEFPPSSTILIPSALLTHYNIPVKDHEVWFSIVQYVAGGLFRWAANGFMTDKAWHEKATAEMKEQKKRNDAKRWGNFLDKFTTYDELME